MTVTQERKHSANPRLPMWARVWSFAQERAEDNGHTPLLPGQLRHALGSPRPAEVSRAIASAVRLGLLTPESSARCLVLTGEHPSGHRCEAMHKAVR